MTPAREAGMRTLIALTTLGLVAFSVALLLVHAVLQPPAQDRTPAPRRLCQEHWSYQPEEPPYVACWRPMF